MSACPTDENGEDASSRGTWPLTNTRSTDGLTPTHASIIEPVELNWYSEVLGTSGEIPMQATEEVRDPRMCTLRVIVKQANNLKRQSALRGPRAIVMVQLVKRSSGNVFHKVGKALYTPTVGRSVNPLWECCFNLRIHTDNEQFEKYAVRCTVLESRRQNRVAARTLGTTLITITNLPIGTNDPDVLREYTASFPLEKLLDTDRVSGHLRLGFLYEPASTDVPRDNGDANDAGEGAAVAMDTEAVTPAFLSAGPTGGDHTHRMPRTPGLRRETSRVLRAPDALRNHTATSNTWVLPPNWVMCRTGQGRPFFIDHSSKCTTFDDPRRSEAYTAYYAQRGQDGNRAGGDDGSKTGGNADEAHTGTLTGGVLADTGEPPLPRGWEERIDIDGRRFYVDHSNKKTSWRDPRTGKRSKRPKVASAAVFSQDFKEKVKKFRASLQLNVREKQNILVSRNDVFNTSFNAVMALTPEELRRTPYVTFHGERGLDYGGLQREWFHLLSHEIFNPVYGLFEYTSGNAYALQINRNSAINPDHLQYFRFIGRIIGMAVYHANIVEAFFVRPLYKAILDKGVTVEDMAVVDPEYYKSMMYVLENDPSLLGFTFSVDEQAFGTVSSVDLKPGGADIDVTNENKEEYVRLVCERRMVGCCREQLENFVIGFRDVVPKTLLQKYKFDEKDLELLIGGIADINLRDWQRNTTYAAGYTAYSPTVQWFWEAVLSFSPANRARLLQFVTGSARVPMNGFGELQGSNGPQKFCIKQWGNIKDLPRAHTCFNRIDLPAYNSYKLVREKLLIAVENTEGFGGVD
eukprot:m.671357 g.671357  ORF g.671357 m.671357 type:complete len:803 (-) comp22771_c0_seq3:541-2949(-)